MSDKPKWTLEQLQEHLQAAVDLEFWTIPFYLSAMYSIKDPGNAAYQMILSVVNQEMLHVQLAANLANAYGLSPTFAVPIYEGGHIPHLDFNIDKPNPEEEFPEHSSEIGPYDTKRLDTMCLIEYPMWLGAEEPRWNPDYVAYGSIGQFYEAVSIGAAELCDYIRPANQVNLFKRFYNEFEGMAITEYGKAGLPQVVNIVTGICDQGEGRVGGGRKGQNQGVPHWSKHSIPSRYRNTADDTDPSWTHFQKFMSLRQSCHFPEVYTGDPTPPKGSTGEHAQQILIENFNEFRQTLGQLFSGHSPGDFATKMNTLGGNILNCWKNGATPCFYPKNIYEAADSIRTFPKRARLLANPMNR